MTAMALEAVRGGRGEEDVEEPVGVRRKRGMVPDTEGGDGEEGSEPRHGKSKKRRQRGSGGQEDDQNNDDGPAPPIQAELPKRRPRPRPMISRPPPQTDDVEMGDATTSGTPTRDV